MCINIIEKGKCSYDYVCQFAHHESELRPYFDEKDEDEEINKSFTIIR